MQYVKCHHTIEDFLERCGTHLEIHEVENGLMLGLVLREQKLGGNTSDVILLSVWERDDFKGAAIQTPPRNLVISQMGKEAIEAMVEYLLEHHVEFPGIVGPEPTVGTFAAAWKYSTGNSWSLHMKQMMYALHEVIPVNGIPGTCIQASTDALEIVAKWFQAFGMEALPFNAPPTWSQSLEDAARRIGKEEIFLWKLGDSYRSMAGVSSPTPNGIRVNGVFTPKEYRGKGYASTHVATVSQLQLAQGRKFCFLYTDATNPTSNKVYQQIGYQFVCHGGLYIF
ncbi:MAG: GNAT family N-acetyltransferase [Bacteroidota bacterium]